MADLCLWHLGSGQHLKISLPSLSLEEREAFPELIADSAQEAAAQCAGWHFYLHYRAYHIQDRTPGVRPQCSLLQGFPVHSEQQGFRNARTHGSYLVGSRDW